MIVLPHCNRPRGSSCCPVERIQNSNKNDVRLTVLSRSVLTSSFQSRSVFSFLSQSSCAAVESSSNENRNEYAEKDNESSFLMNKTKLSMPLRQHNNGKNGKQRQISPVSSPRQQSTLFDFEIRELLSSPVGSFQPSTWLQVEGYLKYLREREEINRAFQLLDRVVQEPDASIQSTSDFVYLVVQDWIGNFAKQQQRYQRIPSRRSNHRTLTMDQHQDLINDQRPTLSPLAVWRKIESYQRRGIPLESPVYQRIIEGTAYVRSRKPNHPSGPILAETILENMMSQSERKNPLLRPSVSVFRAVLSSWCQAAAYCPDVATDEAPHRSMAVLNKLRALYDSGWGDDFLPDKMCFYSVMRIHARIGDGDTVESLLEDLYTLYLDHNEKLYDLRPTTSFFSLVLYAWSLSHDPGAAERAEAILDRMLEIEAKREIRNMRVSAKCFNIVMVCWNKLHTLEGTNKVQHLFDRMVKLSRRDKTKIPTGSSYVALMYAWAHHDPFKVERVYRMWLEEHEKGHCEIRQDSVLLGALVAAWYRSDEPGKADRCDDLIQEAIQSNKPDFQPTTAIFNMAVRAWCKTKTVDGIQRAEELLLQMEKCNSSSSPDVLTYLAIIQGWVDLSRTERAEELLTDCFLQIEGYNGSFDETEPEEHASEETLVSEKNRRGKWRKPTKTQILNCVLKSWLSKAPSIPEAASRAEQLLLSTPTFGVKPNAASFQYVLDAWRKNDKYFKGATQTVPKVEEVLALLDRESGGLGGNDTLYLKLRRDWKLLSVR